MEAGVSHTPHSLQCYLQVPANPNKKDVLRLLLLGCGDVFTHTCCSPLPSQNSHRVHSSLKMSQGDYTTPSPGICTQQAHRECGKSPRDLSLLQQFKFQRWCLLTKQTWLFHHSNVSVTSNSVSHSFSSIFFPPHSLPFARNPSSPLCCTICLEKKIFFRSCFLPSVTSTHSYLVMSTENSLFLNVYSEARLLTAFCLPCRCCWCIGYLLKQMT